MNLLIQLKLVVQAHETRSGMLGQLGQLGQLGHLKEGGGRGGEGCNCSLESSYATAGSGYYSMKWHEDVARFEF